jgi:hypothetical protein
MKTFSLVLCILVFTNSLFSQEIEKKSNRDSKFQLSISSGASFRIAKIDKSVNEIYRNQIKNLKSGWNYDFDLVYKITKNNGFGLKFNQFQSNYTSTTLILNLDSNGNLITNTSNLLNSHKITFIGPLYRFESDRKNNSFCSNFYIGHVKYTSTETIVLGKTKQSASSLGFGFDYIYYFGLNKNFQIGPKLAYMSSTFSKYKQIYSDGSSEVIKFENNQRESLARIDLSVALKYKL